MTEFIGPVTSGDYEAEMLCEQCGEGFLGRVYVMRLSEAFRTRACPACVAKRQEQERESQTRPKTRQEKWAEYCPSLYLKTDLSRLRKEEKLTPKFPKMSCGEFLDSVRKREYSAKGVGLIGGYRLGKTRIMFSLLGRYYLAGRRVMYVYAPDFSDHYAALMGESPAKGNAYLESCINAEAWFLDDLGKGRLSEASQRALLRVVEKRSNQERPIFLTANEDGDGLIQRMRYEDGSQSEYAQPLVERLREFCDFYIF